MQPCAISLKAAKKAAREAHVSRRLAAQRPAGLPCHSQFIDGDEHVCAISAGLPPELRAHLRAHPHLNHAPLYVLIQLNLVTVASPASADKLMELERAHDIWASQDWGTTCRATSEAAFCALVGLEVVAA